MGAQLSPERTIRIALTAIIALHGLIHALGVLKWWNLAPVTQLSGRTLLPLPSAAHGVFGLFWLLALLLLLGAAGLRMADQDAWWALALVGVLISQALVVVAWPDAKAGTVANVIVLVPTLMAAAHASFDRQVADEVRLLLAGDHVPRLGVVQPGELDNLPAPVRRWLEASGVVGRERAHTVRLQQRGLLRTAPDKPWMPARAVQYFAVDRPAFIWQVDATMMNVLPIAGRDRYFEGRGHMLIKVASLLNVVDQSDDKISEGSLLRFLAEVIWFPSAALSSYLQWQPVDDERARVTMRDAGHTVNAEFSFDAQGRMTGMRAERYLGGGADAKLTPWLARCDRWATVRGVQLPTHGEVLWALPAGEFSYYRWEITDVETNRPELYGPGERARAMGSDS